MKPFVRWLNFHDLMKRWGTTIPENVIEAINAGLPVYEKAWCEDQGGGPKKICFLKIPDDECKIVEEQHIKGTLNGFTVLFQERDVEEFERTAECQPERELQIAPPKHPSILDRHKGGRAKEPFAEAIKHLHDRFQAEGNTEVLQRGNIQEFVTRLRDSIVEGNRNFSEYIAERVMKVKKTSGGWQITTYERRNPGSIYIPSKQKRLNDVSKILNKLRKEKPLDP